MHSHFGFPSVLTGSTSILDQYVQLWRRAEFVRCTPPRGSTAMVPFSNTDPRKVEKKATRRLILAHQSRTNSESKTCKGVQTSKPTKESRCGSFESSETVKYSIKLRFPSPSSHVVVRRSVQGFQASNPYATPPTLVSDTCNSAGVGHDHVPAPPVSPDGVRSGIHASARYAVNVPVRCTHTKYTVVHCTFR